MRKTCLAVCGLLLVSTLAQAQVGLFWLTQEPLKPRTEKTLYLGWNLDTDGEEIQVKTTIEYQYKDGYHLAGEVDQYVVGDSGTKKFTFIVPNYPAPMPSSTSGTIARFQSTFFYIDSNGQPTSESTIYVYFPVR